MQRRWKFYDFDANWDDFYRVWTMPDVQNMLKKNMDYWCKHEAYVELDNNTPTWNIGDPLWHLSRSDYWLEKISQKVENKMERENTVAVYKKRMEAIYGFPIFTNDIADNDDPPLYETIYKTCYDAIWEDFEPKKGTIDSLIMIMGNNYMTDALYLAAKKLFPTNHVLYDEDQYGTRTILIVEKFIVFDLMGFYFQTRDEQKHSILLDDTFYDKMIEFD